MAARIARRLGGGVVATGGAAAMVRADAVFALLLALLVVGVFGGWVLSNNLRTNRLVRVITAVKASTRSGH